MFHNYDTLSFYLSVCSPTVCLSVHLHTWLEIYESRRNIIRNSYCFVTYFYLFITICFLPIISIFFFSFSLFLFFGLSFVFICLSSYLWFSVSFSENSRTRLRIQWFTYGLQLNFKHIIYTSLIRSTFHSFLFMSIETRVRDNWREKCQKSGENILGLSLSLSRSSSQWLSVLLI